MSYTETIEYLYTLLPMFQRQGNAAMVKYDLTGITELCERLGNPQKKLKAIHVAGTNGKGSTCSMLASVLMESGIEKVGLYTSPHLKSFTERIRLNGQPVSEEFVVDFVAEHCPLIETNHYSFFEFTTAMMFCYFAESADVCVIEVGMGGRLDSTNIIQPLLSVITGISFDHTEFLGETLAEIASEKGGIIKPHTPVVIAQTQAETTPVFQEIAQKQGAPLFFADQEIGLTLIKESLISNTYQTNTGFIFDCDLTGHYQIRNLTGVLKAVAVWNELPRHFPTITSEVLLRGLANVKRNSGLRGRMEIISEKPLTIADIAHNPDATVLLMNQLKSIPPEKLRFVIGFVKEKDLGKMLPLYPAQARYYFVCPPVPRGLPAEEARRQALAFGLKGESYADIPTALHVAQTESTDDEVIIVTGSAFVVAEAIPNQPYDA
jgi:dihydrofolate synthase/folylpolyglutamate synthase